MTHDDQPIIDNVDRKRWEIHVDGAVAALEYSRGPTVLVLAHTEIPEKLGGRGLAGRLARHAMTTARDAGLRVEPVCPFMIGWLDRHTEYADLVVRRGGPPADEPIWF